MINPEMTDPATTRGRPPVSSLDLQSVVALRSSLICGAEQVSALFCKASDGLQDETAHGGKERMECPHDTTANAAA